MTRAALQPIPVRGLRSGDAARYLGMSESKFKEMVGESRIPNGFTVDGMRIWDIRDLDAAFDLLKAGQDAFTLAGDETAVDGGWKGVAP